jgi:DNA-directed RNA polymerase III subunit RPC8
MFILINLKDRIRILPELFKEPFEDAIAEELNTRFSNKVIINVGLCITLFDILDIQDSFIYQSDGAAHTTGKTIFMNLIRFVKLI